MPDISPVMQILHESYRIPARKIFCQILAKLFFSQPGATYYATSGGLPAESSENSSHENCKTRDANLLVIALQSQSLLLFSKMQNIKLWKVVATVKLDSHSSAPYA